MDLDCFDDYQLAVRIANSNLPIITGIGHERDETVADLVAHSQLKTPTAVAEFILSSFRIFEENMVLLATRIDRITNQQLKLAQNQLGVLSQQIQSLVLSQIRLENERIESRKERVIRAANLQTKNQLEFFKLIAKIHSKPKQSAHSKQCATIGKLGKDAGATGSSVHSKTRLYKK